MASSSPYDASPHLRAVPVRQDEVEALVYAGGRPLLRDQDALLHFLDRVVAALKEARATQDTLRGEWEAAQLQRQAQDHPFETARRALAALDEQQQRALLDAGYWEAVDELATQRRAFEMSELATVAALRKVRFVLSSLLSEPGLSAPAADAIRRAITDLPSPPPPVGE